MSQVAVV